MPIRTAIEAADKLTRALVGATRIVGGPGDRAGDRRARPQPRRRAAVPGRRCTTRAPGCTSRPGTLIGLVSADPDESAAVALTGSAGWSTTTGVTLGGVPGSPTCRWRPCAAGCWCPRPSRGCSPARCATSSTRGAGAVDDAALLAALRRGRRRRRARRAARGPRRRGRRGAAGASPAASGSGSPWPARCSPTPTSSCSSSRPARSTRTPRRWSRAGCGGPARRRRRRGPHHRRDQRQPAAARPLRRGRVPRRRPGRRDAAPTATCSPATRPTATP